MIDSKESRIRLSLLVLNRWSDLDEIIIGPTLVSLKFEIDFFSVKETKEEDEVDKEVDEVNQFGITLGLRKLCWKKVVFCNNKKNSSNLKFEF